jgi:hypothetical protein
MNKFKLILGWLVLLGLVVGTAYVSQMMSSDGTVNIQNSDQGENDTSDEPVDTYFESTGETTRSADYEGEEVEPGDTVTDRFTVVNDHESDVTLNMDGCTQFPRNYYVNGDFRSDDSGQYSFGVESGSSATVDVEIEIPEDVETGQRNLCTEIEASP